MTRGLWLIAYDITCPKRLASVHRFLNAQPLPLQYSVFLAELTQAALDHVIHELAKRIDPRSDDVRAYLLPGEGAMETIGRPWIPEGITGGTTPQLHREFRVEAAP